MTDYKGEEKLCKKYSINPIKDIYAKIVREEDDFEEYVEKGQQYINFRPKAFNNRPIVGAFAVVLFQDGSMLYETMSKEEIEYTRDQFSKQAKGQAWTKSYGEMARKTVLRRLCKHIQLDFDNIEQQKAWEDGGDLQLETKPAEPATEKSDLEKALEQTGDIKENIIEAEFEEMRRGDN
jgi:recombination protein RecT